ncbi:MAG: hypothetical protein D3923_18210 [Candidatus Electrothrix sp. AR3]|nr:hypothetical protein [Candidatus Electrothrix sp. AR3]
MAFFPSLLGGNSKRYAQLATWLVSQFGIVNHALRDTFSAGGQVLIRNEKFPKIYKHLIYDLEKIFDYIQTIDEDDLKHYWEIDNLSASPMQLWKDQCLMHSSEKLSNEQLSIVRQILDNEIIGCEN